VETFLLPDGSVLLNEVAPRPHNSGHYTIEACPTSQFEAHLRAVLGWPLGDCGLQVGASIMLNILGEADGEEGERLAHELMGRAYAVPGASVHWYGKAGVASNRKVGHITIVGKDNQECRDRLRAIDPGGAQGKLPGMFSAVPCCAVQCSAVMRSVAACSSLLPACWDPAAALQFRPHSWWRTYLPTCFPAAPPCSRGGRD
jgi:phosphoribosylaminoimidazole carboxylase